MLNECRALDDTFATDGWDVIQRTLRDKEKASIGMLEKSADSWDLILTHRSRLILIRELMGLQEATAERAAQARDTLNEEDVDG